MSFSVVHKGSLEYIICNQLNGAAHCFSTRFGGVSEGCLAGLNLGVHRGDTPKNVLENYRILGKALDFAIQDTVFTRQLHTDIVERVTRENRGEGLFRPVIPARDALICDEPGVALTVFTADCAPILLCDPVRRAIGGAHAGWRGTASGIARNTVDAMVREYGCDPKNIVAAIGPCIGKCCFETDGDVPAAMLAAIGPEAGSAITPHEDKFLVDLKALNVIWLRRAGVTRIEVCPDCTACQPQRFWSHRVTGGKRGSMANIIMLK